MTWLNWLLLLWLFPIAIVAYFYAATKSLWFHLHFPPHKARMARAVLCLEAADHFGAPTNRTWIAQAYRLCWDCGCPPDLWPVDVVKVHAGTYV